MDPVIRSACWFTSMKLAGWEVDWTTGMVRRPPKDANPG